MIFQSHAHVPNASVLPAYYTIRVFPRMLTSMRIVFVQPWLPIDPTNIGQIIHSFHSKEVPVVILLVDPSLPVNRKKKSNKVALSLKLEVNKWL
jgi:hypothetical protein